MPVYNGSSYIEKTLETVFVQDVECFEIIVVDDGSEDGTHELVQKILARNTSRHISTRLIRQENSGVSVARNAAIDIATGEYIVFFDSDDLMDPDFLKAIYRRIEDTHSDIAICGFDRTAEDGVVLTPYSDSYGYFEGVVDGQTATHLMLQGKIRVWTGSAMYKTELIRKNSLKFTEGCHFAEDYEFIMKALYTARSVTCVDSVLVSYVQREGSASQANSSRLLSEVASRRRVREFLSSKGAPQEIIHQMDSLYIPRSYISVLQALAVEGSPTKELRNLLSNPEVKKAINNYSPDLKKCSIKLFLLKRFPLIYLKHHAHKVKKGALT